MPSTGLSQCNLRPQHTCSNSLVATANLTLRSQRVLIGLALVYATLHIY